MADQKPFPWLYLYREDPQHTRLGQPVLLGSVGFLDRFTVTASRFAQAIAVEGRDAFDERFGIVHVA